MRTQNSTLIAISYRNHSTSNALDSRPAWKALIAQRLHGDKKSFSSTNTWWFIQKCMSERSCALIVLFECSPCFFFLHSDSRVHYSGLICIHSSNNAFVYVWSYQFSCYEHFVMCVMQTKHSSPVCRAESSKADNELTWIFLLKELGLEFNGGDHFLV